MEDEQNKRIEINRFINKYRNYIDETISIAEQIKRYNNGNDEMFALKRDFKNNDQISYEAEQYIKWLINRLDRIFFVNLLQLKYIYQSYHKIELINQFEIDYLYVMFLKYDTNKSSKQMFELQYYSDIMENMLKLTRIIYTFKQLQLNQQEKSLNISQYYRVRRFLSKKTTQIYLANSFAKELDKLKLKISFERIIKWMIELSDLCIRRYNAYNNGEVSLSEVFEFSSSDPDFVNGLNEQEINLVLESFSVDHEAIKKQEDDELYLVNCIDSRFLECYGDCVRVTNIGDIYNAFFSKIMMLFNQAPYLQYAESANYIRDIFLESELSNMLSESFGKEVVFVNSNWHDGNVNGENDCLVIIDSVALIFEAKASTVNEGIRKGLLKNTYNWNKKNIQVGLQQGKSFKTYLEKHFGNIITLKVKGGGQNVIDLSEVTTIYNFVILLDATPLQNIQRDLLEDKHLLAPVLTIFQLKDILSQLKLISEKVDYFRKRFLIEQSIRYIGDEEDFLLRYQISGLNTDKKLYSPKSEGEVIFLWSEEVEKMSIQQPDDFWRHYISMMEVKKSSGWLKTNMSILELPPKVKVQIMREIKQNDKIILEDNISSRKKLVYVRRLKKQTIELQDMHEMKLQVNSDIKTILVILFNDNLKKVNIHVIDNNL